ncbi:MAG: transglycosylase SLT domain-containing protein [Xanthobacteraceae bacterium]
MLVGSAIGGTEPAVAGVIRTAANATGTNFGYLLATAKVESGLNPNASAKTSSAQGLFQFIDRTWLSTLKQAGPSLGYGKYAAAITRDANGQLSVSDPQMRQQIFALRSDPAANAAMAGAFTRTNAAQLADKLGRPASEGELYMAHFLGANGASKLISLASQQPGASAAASFPRAAAANRSIFYDANGKARSASDVYAKLAGRYDNARAGVGPTIAALQSPAAVSPPVTPVSRANNVTPLSNVIAAAAAAGDTTSIRAAAGLPAQGQSFQSLFSDGRRGPVSDVVRDLWTTRPRVAAALSGVSAPPNIPAPTGAVSAAPVASATPVAPATPAERVQNLFNDLLSSIHS